MNQNKHCSDIFSNGSFLDMVHPSEDPEKLLLSEGEFYFVYVGVFAYF